MPEKETLLFESNQADVIPMQHYVYGLNPVINLLKDRNVSPGPFLERANIAADNLIKAEHMLSADTKEAFFADVYTQLKAPDLGLHLGRYYHLSSIGLLGLAIMSSCTLLGAYQVLLDNIILTWTCSKVRVYHCSKYAYVELDPLRDYGKLLPFVTERDFSCLILMTSEALEESLPVERLELTYSQPEYAQQYSEVFSCPIAFNSPHNRLVFDKSWLDRALPKSDPATNAVFVGQCIENARLLRMAQPTFTEQVRYIVTNSRNEDVSIKNVAN